jgi:hypothetical protein
LKTGERKVWWKSGIGEWKKTEKRAAGYGMGLYTESSKAKARILVYNLLQVASCTLQVQPEIIRTASIRYLGTYQPCYLGTYKLQVGKLPY